MSTYTYLPTAGCRTAARKNDLPAEPLLQFMPNILIDGRHTKLLKSNVIPNYNNNNSNSNNKL